MLLNSCINKHPFLSALIVSFSWVIALTIFVSPVYDTYDDSLVEWFLTGVLICPQPTSDVYFINIILSKLLVALYQLHQDFNWYGGFQIASIVLSVAVINYLIILHYPKSISLKVLGFVIVFLFVSNIIYKVQFTQTSQLATFCGFFILMFSIHNPFHFFLATIMLCIGLMVRWEGFLMASFIGSASLITKQYFDENISVKSISYCVSAFILTLLIFIFHQYYYFKHDDWKQHLAFHQEHVMLFDYSYLDRIPKEKAANIIQQSNWDTNDIKMYSTFFMDDDSIFSIHKMKELTKHFRLIDYFNYNNLSRIRHVLNMFTVSYSLHVFLIVLLFLILPLCLLKDYKNIGLFFLSSYLWVIIFFILIVLFLRLPSLRFLMIPLLFPAFFALFYKSEAVFYIINKRKYLATFLFCFCVVLIVVKMNVLQKENTKNLQAQAKLYNEIKLLDKHNKNFLVIFNLKSPWGKKGLFTSNDNLKNIHAWIAGNDLRSPTMRKIWNYYGIKNITNDLPKNDKMLLVINTGDEPKVLYPYIQFMKRYYHQNVQYKRIEKTAQLSFYKLSTK